MGDNPSLGFHLVEASQLRVEVFSMCGSSQRRSLELTTAMRLTFSQVRIQRGLGSQVSRLSEDTGLAMDTTLLLGLPVTVSLLF